MSTPLVTRVPFEEVINEPLLLAKAWQRLSPPQQSALKIFYGLELDEEGLRHYNMFREQATYDDLGFVKHVEPALDYVPREHDEAWAIMGRRSAKTSNFLSFILVYEALLGGHTAFASPKQQIASFIVAQKLDVAQAIIRDFIEPLVSSSKLLEKEIVKNNADGIVFRNGHKILPAPPVIKNFRYYAIPVVALDECSFWYKDSESANPDYEVVRAISPAQAQFPYKKTVGASTMWTKEGIIWEAKNAGTYGYKLADDDDRKPKFKHSLVLVAPTPAMQNPLLQDRKWFEREYAKDPEAYKREILNIASESVSGLFGETLLRKALENAPTERAPVEGVNFYIAALDPAFRGDDFTFTIGHYEQKLGFVQDLIKKWSPKDTKLNPSVILDSIKLDLERYHVETVYSDQYQLESLQQLALDRGFSIIGMDFTANSKTKIFGSFLQLLRNDRVKLLRDYEQFQQFLWIQRTIGHGGYVRISAPVGKHDDLVMVTVLCAAMAIRFEPERDVERKGEPTPFERIMAGLNKKPEQDAEFL